MLTKLCVSRRVASCHVSCRVATTVEMSFPFKEATIKYCLRLIDQSNLKPGGDGSAPAKAIKGFGGDYPDLVLVEAIRILDLVCRLDTAQVSSIFSRPRAPLHTSSLTMMGFCVHQVPSLFPAVKKIFNRESTKKNGQVFLALLQFFVNHGIVVGYDVEPVFRTYFESYLSTHCTFSPPINYHQPRTHLTLSLSLCVPCAVCRMR
jgi:hypothetical protein